MHYLKPTMTLAAACIAAGGIAMTGSPATGAPLEEMRVLSESSMAEGIIEAVRADKMEFDLRVETNEGASEIITITVKEDTAYTLDGEASTMPEALAVGREATVEHEDKVASRVDVTTKS